MGHHYPAHQTEGISLVRFESKPGVYFSMIPETWSDAWIEGRMDNAAMKIVHFLSRKPTGFKTTQRFLAEHMNLSLTTINKAIANLYDLGVAIRNDHGAAKYMVDPNIRISQSEDEVFIKTVPVKSSSSVTETGTSCTRNWNTSVSETGTPNKSNPIVPDSSLRSEPARARPVATISTGSDGQSGFSFNDDQGVIPENDIQRIMAELRRSGVKGDPDDYELRDFITSRIAFMTSSTFKGRPMVRGDKDVAQANRNRVVTFCMRIIDKADFKWSSKRVDPSLRKKADDIREQIAQLTKSAAMYRMQDGSVISSVEYDAIALDIQTHRNDMINARIQRKPSTHTSQSWRRYLNESFTVEVVAKYVYGERAPAHLPADEDRGAQRRQITALQAELAAMV